MSDPVYRLEVRSPLAFNLWELHGIFGTLEDARNEMNGQITQDALDDYAGIQYRIMESRLVVGPTSTLED